MSAGSFDVHSDSAEPAQWRTRGLRIALYGLFMLSGMAGLIYEAFWARYLGLFVGHTAYAQILVLTIFLGGMALGALAVGKRSERVRDPLHWYARMEAAVGVLGLLFHPLYVWVTQACYDGLFPWLGGSRLLPLVQWALASSLILPPSILLGTTFPLMSAGVLRRCPGAPGRTLSLLYFSNSFGAAVGVLIAGFVLIHRLGLPGTIMVAAFINLGVAALTALLGVLVPVPARAAAGAERAPAPAAQGLPPRLRRFLFGIAFGTAVASFIYEIGWIRMLSLVLGSASHSFELMLSSFILGLACGSLWVRRRADEWRSPETALAVVQWLMGMAALATLPLYAAQFGWMNTLIHALTPTEAGYQFFSIARYTMCLVVMLPATFCAGITLPLITRILFVRGEGERAIGRVYGLNTFGSILGAVTAGLVLLPALGTKNLIVVGAVLDAGLGLGLLLASAEGRAGRGWVGGGAAILAASVLACLFGVDFDLRMLSSGPFRGGFAANVLERRPQFHEDGRTATISVYENPGGARSLTTNGKVDASLAAIWYQPCGGALEPLQADSATQALTPLIALAHHPDARQVAIVGFGSGITTHFMLSQPAIESVETIEIEPAVVRGARGFYPANARAYDDPRSRIVIADARTHFAAVGKHYDIIISEPSNPWVSGVSSLFTREWYDHVSRYLTDDGVFAQWIQLYEIDDDLVLSTLAAVHRSFPAYELFLTSGADLLIVASRQPRMRSPDWSVLSLPAVAQSLCQHPPLTPKMLEAARVSHRAALAPLLDGWTEVNSDFFPVLELGSERTRYLHAVAQGVVNLHADRVSIAAPFFDRRVLTGGEPVAPVSEIPGMRQAALAGLFAEPGSAPAEVARDPLVQKALFEVGQWSAALASRRPPVDWKLWLGEMRRRADSVQGDLRGATNDAFYKEIAAYLTATQAPQVVVDVVAFREAVARWEFERAIDIGKRLYPSALRRENFLPTSELLDGLVVASLRVGDLDGADLVYQQLSRFASAVQLGQLRYRLLRSYIAAAREQRAAMQSASAAAVPR